jgi:hypothetical protein
MPIPLSIPPDLPLEKPFNLKPIASSVPTFFLNSAVDYPYKKIQIKGKKVIQPMTKEDLTSTRWGCYEK